MSTRKEHISYRAVVKSMGIKVGDQVTFKIPGSDRADIGVVKSITRDQMETPLYVLMIEGVFTNRIGDL